MNEVNTCPPKKVAVGKQLDRSAHRAEGRPAHRTGRKGQKARAKWQGDVAESLHLAARQILDLLSTLDTAGLKEALETNVSHYARLVQVLVQIHNGEMRLRKAEETQPDKDAKSRKGGLCEETIAAIEHELNLLP